MKDYNSLNIIDSAQKLRIDSENKFSLPPGCGQQPIKGLFTLKLKTNYLNIARESTAMKCKFWGMEEGSIEFTKLSQTQTILNLNIKSSIEYLSKYFKDMKLLCIEIWSSSNKQFQVPAQTKKNALQSKQLGWIFINLQRFLINHILSNFQENVNIVDMRKQKIGEAEAILTLTMYKQQLFNQNFTEQKIQQPIPDSKKQSFLNQEQIKQKLITNREPQISKPQKYENKESIKRISNQQQVSFIDKYEMDRQDRRNVEWQNNFRKKGKAQQYLDQYKKNKPEHTELSLIRNKYGLNNPSVQVMKLKFDEAQLLGNNQKTDLKHEQRLNILLKTLKVDTKSKTGHLIIYSEQRSKNLKTETKIILQEQKNLNYQINYLYMLPNNSSDLLIFELDDARLEIQIKQLLNLEKLELKNKKNKKIGTIEFTLIADKNIEHSISKLPQKSKEKIEVKKNEQNKKKQNCYINILNWPSQKIVLKNINFGTAKAFKLFFESQRSQNNETLVELETQTGQKITLNISMDHLFKQQNFVIKDKSVKIITSKGQLSQILGLIQKLQPQKNSIPQRQQNTLKKGQYEMSESLKDLMMIFQKLQTSDNVECGQLLQNLLNQERISNRHIQRLQTVLSVQPSLLSKILQTIFKNNFRQFYSFFHVYHKWNHRYLATQKRIKKIIQNTQFKRSMLKTIKSIKKSSEVIFGVTNTNYFFNQFLHHNGLNQQIHTENAEDDLDSQQLCHLIILVLQRYYNKSIKVGQLQQFCQNQNNFLNLNMYLLNKMSTQILQYSEEFKEFLSESQFSFALLFKKDKIAVSQLGLAKLLLCSDQQVDFSVLTHSQQNGRKQTQMNQMMGQIIKTEQSKQPIRIQNQQFDENKKKHQTQQIDELKPNKKITLIINKILVDNQRHYDQIVLISQKQKIKIPQQQLALPKAIQLSQNLIYNVQIKIGQQNYVGVFIALAQYNKVKLYLHDKESGFVQLFSPFKKNQTQQSDIVISLATQQKLGQKSERMNEPSIQRQKQDYQTLSNKLPKAKSSKIKMKIRSIRPSRTNYQLAISNSQDQQLKVLNFPDQLEVVLLNDEKGWKMNLLDELYEQITIPNIIGSYTYCFVNKNDQKVAYSAIIQIQQNWNPQFSLQAEQLLHISINIETIISTKLFDLKIYQINLEYDGQIIQIATVKNQTLTKTLTPEASIMLNKIPEKTVFSIVDKQQKQIKAQFNLILRIINKGIDRSQRFLISQNGLYRLKLSVIQIRHNWKYCKSDRIVNLFINPNKKTIQSWIKSVSSISQDNIRTWIRSTFSITLGQIDILLNDILKAQDNNGFQEFIKLFKSHQFRQINKMEEIEQEFNIFDLNQTGLISNTQLTLVKKTLQRNFKQVFDQLIQHETDFETSPSKPNNFIIDLSSHQNQQEFDYLSFLSLFQNNLYSPALLPPPPKQKQHKKQCKLISIKLISFTKLSINGSPCTLLFKVNNNSLAQPIHRCYSYTYPHSETIIIPIQANQLEIYCQKLNSEGNWEYRLVQKANLAKQIKILGGVINIQINQIEENASLQPTRQRENKFKNTEFSPIKLSEQILKQNEQKHNESVDFSKSFWNKSLNQTKQKWARSGTLGTNKKQGRKLADLNNQQMRRKLQVFQRQWQD